jgi:Zn finger protein HypA/HybF involved in hydrogenase expression
VHELSLALDVCRIAEEYVGAGALNRVTAVGLDVGSRSGIEIENFEFCLEALLGSPPFGSAVPVIQQLEGDELRVTYVEVEEDDGTPD